MCKTSRNEECQVSEWTQHSTREIRWVWSYWEQIYPQTQTLVQSLTPGLCYLCNPASIKYTYDCTYTQPQTHTYTHTGTHYRHPAHTLFQSGLYRSRDRRPHHIERTVLGSITPVRPGHSMGLGWGRDGGEVGWRWCWKEAGWGSGGGVVWWVGAVLSRSCFAKDGEVSQHKFHWYHLHQRAIKLIYYKYSSHVFTARILGPATSFKVSTCRCSGSVSVGQIGGNQGKKGRKAKTGTGRHREKGQWTRGGKEKGITDGGKLGKHGSHNSGESEVIRIMCESIKLLAVTPLSAPRKYICGLKLIGLCCKQRIPPSA